LISNGSILETHEPPQLPGLVTVTSAVSPAAVAVHPSGFYLVVGNQGRIAVLLIQPENLNLSHAAQSPVAVPGRVSGMAFPAHGELLEISLPDFGGARAIDFHAPFPLLQGSLVGNAGGSPAGVVRTCGVSASVVNVSSAALVNSAALPSVSGATSSTSRGSGRLTAR